MKVLVAGRGFIGKNIVSKLRENHEVRTLDKNPDATYQQDITESFDIQESFDVLIHAIGLAPGLHSAESYRSVHVEGTENLLDAVKSEKVIFVSALGAGEVNHSFFQTKKKAEQIVSQTHNYTIIRPSTVYGKENKILDLIRKTAPLMIFPDVKGKTQPIHVEDVKEIIEKSLDSFNKETLKIGGPETMKIADIAEKLYGEKGFPCIRVPVPSWFQKSLLTALTPLPGHFNKEDYRLLNQENTTMANDAEDILENLREI
jgi:nucleoside-diphosphate-sugar epimerase